MALGLLGLSLWPDATATRGIDDRQRFVDAAALKV